MQLRQVDHSAIRVGQAFTIGLLILSFVFNIPLLAVAVAIVNFVGALRPSWGLFRRIYLHLLEPARLVKPNLVADNPEPHQFAQGMGAVVVAIGMLAAAAGLTALGWSLVWLVIGLASLNLFVGFCAGCFLYYQLNRLGVPGFRRSRVERS